MVSNYERGAKVERELVKELLDDGWYAERVAGSGTRENREEWLPSADVVSHDGSRFVVWDCKHVETGFGARDVRETSEKLSEIRDKIRRNSQANPADNGDENEVHFCVQFGGSTVLFVAPYSVNELDPQNREQYQKIWNYLR